MASKETIEMALAYFLAGHNLTETASYLKNTKNINISRVTLNTYFKLFGDSTSAYYNPVIAEKITLMKQKMLIESRAKAGKISKRNQVITDREAEEIINMVIHKGVTLRELASTYNCSHTSIANAIKRVATSKELELINAVYNQDVNVRR